MALQANTTFLPILDDLLSPEFRPVLQTPTNAATPKTFGKSSVLNSTYTNGNEVLNSMSKEGAKGPNRSQSVPTQLVTYVSHDAASKIQNWWRKRNCTIGENSVVDLKAESAKHSIRHSRTEAHVQHLESEVNRLKTALTTERKLRSLQLEAIRSLWSQVQRISTPMSSTSSKPEGHGHGMGNVGIMSQSMPNGLPISNSPRKKILQREGMSTSYAGEIPSEGDEYQMQDAPVGCTSACAKEIENLKETLTSEISQLREMIIKLRTTESIPESKIVETTSNLTSDSPEDKEARPLQAQRPAFLNIGNRGGQSHTDNPELLSELPDAEEIVDFASQMASKLLDDAVEDEDKDQNEEVSESMPPV